MTEGAACARHVALAYPIMALPAPARPSHPGDAMSAQRRYAASSGRLHQGLRIVRCAGLALFFAAAAALPLVAQSAPSDTVPRAAADPGPARWGPVGPAIGLNVGTPQQVAVAVGVALERQTPDSLGGGVFLFAEPGWRAGRVSVGYMRLLGNWGTGVGARMSLLRTWRDPRPEVPDRTYVGVEGAAYFVGLRVRAGAFRRITSHPGDRRRFTVDVGLGLL